MDKIQLSSVGAWNRFKELSVIKPKSDIDERCLLLDFTMCSSNETLTKWFWIFEVYISLIVMNVKPCVCDKL